MQLRVVPVLLLACTVAACSTDSADESVESSPAECTDEVACTTADPVSEAERPFRLEPPRKTRWPLVLHHGFNASRTNGWSFHGVVEALERDGTFAVATEVEPFHGVAVRAASLASAIDDAIDEFCAARGSNRERCQATTKVNLVAHSMGGLDARWLVSQLGYGDRVATVTTIASPHRGTAVADLALGLLGSDRVNDAVSSLAGFFGRTFTQEELATNADLRAALESLSEANAARFETETPDDPRVEYQSWTGVSRVVGGPRGAAAQQQLREICDGLVFGSPARADFLNAQLVVPASLLASRAGDDFQDGMVSVASAKWGTFRGCIPADHLDEVGQPRREGAAPYTGFDHRIFYRNLATDLGRRGY